MSEDQKNLEQVVKGRFIEIFGETNISTNKAGVIISKAFFMSPGTLTAATLKNTLSNKFDIVSFTQGEDLIVLFRQFNKEEKLNTILSSNFALDTIIPQSQELRIESTKEEGGKNYEDEWEKPAIQAKTEEDKIQDTPTDAELIQIKETVAEKLKTIFGESNVYEDNKAKEYLVIKKEGFTGYTTKDHLINVLKQLGTPTSATAISGNVLVKTSDFHNKLENLEILLKKAMRKSIIVAEGELFPKTQTNRQIKKVEDLINQDIQDENLIYR